MSRFISSRMLPTSPRPDAWTCSFGTRMSHVLRVTRQLASRTRRSRCGRTTAGHGMADTALPPCAVRPVTDGQRARLVRQRPVRASSRAV